MKIAVIGDYSSPQYSDFLKKVKMAKPEDTIMDLSRHTSTNWSKNLNSRFADISESNMVIIANDFRNTLESRRDVTYAQERNRECWIYVEGNFRPFPEYAKQI